MIKFSGKIVQFGFGAVGKSFFEKVKNEIKYNENNYIVVTMDASEFDAYVNMGGIITNFYVREVNKENYKEIFSPLLSSGDLLIDFADTVGTRDICSWCAENNIMYLNTGEADWPDNWYSIFNENLLKNELKEKYKNHEKYNKYPIVLQHGNNPGLVSHFVKRSIEYIVKKQFKKDKELKQLLKENKFNEIAKKLGIRMIHVNDIDLQKIKEEFKEEKLVNTWCVDSFFFELLSEATENIGTHEMIDHKEEIKKLDIDRGFLEYKKLAVNVQCKTYYPNGYFEGFLVPHEETITIAKSLEVKEGKRTVIIINDIEAYLRNTKSNHKNIAKMGNWLEDCARLPLNDTQNAYATTFFFTTNHPLKISESLLLNCEKISELIPMGPAKDNDIEQIIRFYIEKFNKNGKIINPDEIDFEQIIEKMNPDNEKGAFGNDKIKGIVQSACQDFNQDMDNKKSFEEYLNERIDKTKRNISPGRLQQFREQTEELS